MIEYVFELPGRAELRFTIDQKRVYSPATDHATHPDWTALGFNRCAHCPLPETEYRWCPAAIDVEGIVRTFAGISSSQSALIRVQTPERQFQRADDVQTGLNSLLGLVMASSGCPILGELRPLALFHLPFSTPEETIYRTTGNFLLRQYFIRRSGGTPDLELNGLKRLYQNLEQLNADFALRLRRASQNDANINAIANLSSLSMVVRFSLEDHLTEMKSLF